MGTYFELVHYKSQMEKENAFLNKENIYITESEHYSKLPGAPYAYWISDNVKSAFEGTLLGDFGVTKQGFATGSNDTFLRFWFEVCDAKIYMGDKPNKCFFCNKGGSFRKWYGNISYVANWENDGREMRMYEGSVIRNPDFYLRKGLTWSSIANTLSMRYTPENFVFETKGSMYFAFDENNLKYILALLNSKVVDVFLKVLSPTLDFHEGPMSKVPVIKDMEIFDEVSLLSDENIDICQEEWNDFEYSNLFRKHPLIEGMKETKRSILIETKYMEWQKKCQERYEKLRNNEERINKIFIEVYGLNRELEACVDAENISVRLAEIERDIKSFMSYAVGCIMGRYSLKEEGLIYAGGEWDNTRYSEEFKPCEYGVMPITEEQYFEEDLCTRVIDFIKIVYGEDTLTENLKFIASALKPGSFETPKKIIREIFTIQQFICCSFTNTKAHT